jgi:SAM-dependent methyltransferase
MEPKKHWDGIYATKPPDTVSWYQQSASLSLELIQHIAPAKSSRIIDIGGGASVLVDELVARGFEDVSVLDISPVALDIARQRLGRVAHKVHWIDGDITQVDLGEQGFDLWHDRAVFHFLTDPADRAAYVRQVRRSVRPGGHVIVAAFGPDGPLQCSGLPVVRYAPNALHAEFGRQFMLLEHQTEDHLTPWGAIQHFVYCHCMVA